MKKIILTNSFHGTQVTVLTSTPGDARETWLDIQYAALGPAPTRAARAKYRRVCRVLCGIKGCTCGIVRPD